MDKFFSFILLKLKMDDEEDVKLEGREDLMESNNFNEIGSEEKKKKKGKKRKGDGKDKKLNL